MASKTFSDMAYISPKPAGETEFVDACEKFFSSSYTPGLKLAQLQP